MRWCINVLHPVPGPWWTQYHGLLLRLFPPPPPPLAHGEAGAPHLLDQISWVSYEPGFIKPEMGRVPWCSLPKHSHKPIPQLRQGFKILEILPITSLVSGFALTSPAQLLLLSRPDLPHLGPAAPRLCLSPEHKTLQPNWLALPPPSSVTLGRSPDLSVLQFHNL